MQYYYLVLASLFNYVYAQTTDPSVANVTSAFSQAQIVPDVLGTFDPSAPLNITFTDSLSMGTIDVVPGILLTIEQTAMFPQFFLESNSSDLSAETFVLALVDPDAPTPQNTSLAQFRHFLGGDFQMDTSGPDPTLLVNQSAALTEFIGPGPPAGSDPHRYVLLAFVQSPNFDTMAPTFVNASTPRNNFDISNFAAALQLGSPIAGNYFLVGPDDSSSSPSSSTPASVPSSPNSTPASVPGVSGTGVSLTNPFPSPSITPPSTNNTGGAIELGTHKGGVFLGAIAVLLSVL